jgi:hypothetical protein
MTNAALLVTIALLCFAAAAVQTNALAIGVCDEDAMGRGCDRFCIVTFICNLCCVDNMIYINVTINLQLCTL